MQQTYGWRRPIRFIETPRGVDIAIDHNAPGVLTLDPPRTPKPKKRTTRAQKEEHDRCVDVRNHTKLPLRITAPMVAKARVR